MESVKSVKSVKSDPGGLAHREGLRELPVKMRPQEAHDYPPVGEVEAARVPVPLVTNAHPLRLERRGQQRAVPMGPELLVVEEPARAR